MNRQERQVREDEVDAMLNIADSRPQFSTSDAVAIVLRHYGIEASAVPLSSERDQNFLIEDGRGGQWILKIASAADSPSVLDCQNQVLEFLAQAPAPMATPRLRRDLDGRALAEVEGRGGLQHCVRLLTWLPGIFLHQTPHHSPELLRDIGRFMGRLDQSLAGFSHPAAERPLQWDIRTAHQVIGTHLAEIQSQDHRRLVAHFLEEFESQALPALGRLRHSVIHNDGNDHNLLVSPPNYDDPPRDGRKIIGIIDFGDMLYSCTVADAAVACAYAILGRPNPLEAAVQVVGGYHEAYPLLDEEITVLYHLVAIRLCTSVALSARQQRIEPDNRYLSVSESAAWEALEKLSAINSRLAHYAFRGACKLPACPAGAPVIRWLQNHPQEIGRVVDADLDQDRILVFDLSVGSRQLGGPDEYSEPQALTRKLFGLMEAAGAVIGIGRYDEARALYTSDVFSRRGNERNEQRTLHLGMDLFAPPGTAIYAPLDGIVHSIGNNRGKLDYGPTLVLQHAPADGAPVFYTLYGHLEGASLDGLVEGADVQRGQLIARIGNFPENGGWAPHLHLQVIIDMLDRKGDFPGVASPSERELWLGLAPDPNLILGIPPSAFPAAATGPEILLESRNRQLGRSLSVAYRKPLNIVRGWKQQLYDQEGSAYLDCVNNVTHVGHAHPQITAAICEQAALLNTNTRYLHDIIVRYAQRLTATMPEPLRVCFFVNSGSEANDLALRLARAHTRKQGIVVVDGAYHGNLTSLIEISPYKHNGPGGSGTPSFVFVAAMPDPYRGRFRSPAAGLGPRYAVDVARAADEAAGKDTGLAAFICESALSCGGQIILPDGYLREAYRAVRKAGGLCIADEVQVGFGRLGDDFWGFQQQRVVPDIVTMGKPIGNGHPLAAVVTTPEIAGSFANGMEYFNTFGGNPVSCAVGLAVLDIIEQQQLQAHAREIGQYLLQGLRRLMDKHRLIGDVRGLGLFLGVELVRERGTLEPAAKEAAFIVERMKERGVLLSTDGPLHNVLKIKPPMIFTRADADRLTGELDRVLTEDFL